MAMTFKQRICRLLYALLKAREYSAHRTKNNELLGARYEGDVLALRYAINTILGRANSSDNLLNNFQPLGFDDSELTSDEVVKALTEGISSSKADTVF